MILWFTKGHVMWCSLQKKQELMRRLLAPIVSKYEGVFQRMVAETDPKKQLMCAQCLTQAVAYARYKHLRASACGCCLCIEFICQFSIFVSLHMLLSDMLHSRTSKGFTNQQTMKQCGCVEAYTETLKVFLQTLNAPVHRQLLHSSVRQYLHRMVVCLDTEIMPFIPVAMEHLLKSPDAKELHDFIPLLNQVISKFKVGLWCTVM